MQAVVVVAHPCAESFTHALADRVVTGLAAGGHDVSMLDLYQQGFRTAMSPAEREAYHGDRPILDPLVADHAALVGSARTLAFVYPTWWGGLPAILKGWLERVLVPGVAFRFDDRSGAVRPALGHVRHLVGVSTYGSPRVAVAAVNDNGRRTLTRALRLSCGWQTRTHWLGMYALDTAGDGERLDFAARVERTVADLR